MDLLNYNKALDREFLFGTDTMGRDIFSMIWYGGRISILIGGLATVLCLTNIGNACREQTNRKESNF